jgi:hypothetical protein
MDAMSSRVTSRLDPGSRLRSPKKFRVDGRQIREEARGRATTSVRTRPPLRLPVDAHTPVQLCARSWWLTALLRRTLVRGTMCQGRLKCGPLPPGQKWATWEPETPGEMCDLLRGVAAGVAEVSP